MIEPVLQINGNFIAAFTFFDLPSWNQSYSHWTKKAEAVRDLRAEGFKLAREFRRSVDKHGLLNDVFLRRPVLLIVKVFPPFEEISDVPNVNIKHVNDGFVDAKLIKDDEWAFVPIVSFVWAGIDKEPEYRQAKVKRVRKRRTIIEVYTIDDWYLNGVQQDLPLGRIRHAQPIDWAKWEKYGDCE